MSGKPIDGVVQALIEVAVGKVQHLYRGTCPDEIEGFDSRDPQCPACRVLIAVQQDGGDGCHCGTCTCNPNMTPAVRFDLSPAQKEGAIRDHLIALGWTPPGAHQTAAVDEAYPTPRNRAEAVALARLVLAHLGVIDAHIDAAIARCETNSATQHQEPKSCKHDFRRDEDNGGACCQLCGEVKP